MTARHPLAAALLLLAACHQDDSCPDCDGEELADGGEDPDTLVDPSCPGVDLQTDDLNCGSCGHECRIIWPGTDYAAGGCVEGECGPLWSGERTLLPPPFSLTCRELCGFADQECVPDGCAGLTGYVCIEIWDFESECDLSIPMHQPAIEMTGSCDAEPPYLEEFGEFGYFQRYVNCCCARP